MPSFVQLDNLLVLHHKKGATSLVFDILAPETADSRAAASHAAAKASPWARGPHGAPPKPPPHASTAPPVSALTGRPNPNFAPLPARSGSHGSLAPVHVCPASFAPSSPAALLAPGPGLGLSPLDLYGRWRLLWPQRVLDTTSAAGVVWELRANLSALGKRQQAEPPQVEPPQAAPPPGSASLGHLPGPALFEGLFEGPLPGVVLRRGIDCRPNLLLVNVSGAPGDGASAAASGCGAVLRALGALLGALDDDDANNGTGLTVGGRARLASAFANLHEPFAAALRRRRQILAGGGGLWGPGASAALCADRAALASASAAADVVAAAAVASICRPSARTSQPNACARLTAAAAAAAAAGAALPADLEALTRPAGGGGGASSSPPPPPPPPPRGSPHASRGSGSGEGMAEGLELEARLDLWPGDLDSLGIALDEREVLASTPLAAQRPAAKASVEGENGRTVDGLQGKAAAAAQLVDELLVSAASGPRRTPSGRPHPPRSPSGARVIAQRDVFDFVLGPLAEARAVRAPTLIAVLIE